MNNLTGIEHSASRRRFISDAGGALVGGALLGVAGCSEVTPQAAASESDDYPLNAPENVLYSTCLQCNTQCTLKVKHLSGLVAKIDGNPFSPMNLVPQLPFGTDTKEAVVVDAAICSKGQAGVQTLYDPYRLRKVLKRSGPRGSGMWKSIPFEQAIEEIADGGKLFADAGEDRHVPGFNEVIVLRDAALAKSLAADVEAIRAGAMTVEAFKARHSTHLHLLLDPDHPDLGPRNNQFVLQGGRIAPDRENYNQRFTFGTLGSVNWYGHTSICEQAHHVAFMYALATWREEGGKFSWVKGPNQMKPDYTRSEFVIFWGTGYAEANFGPPGMAPRLSRAIVDGKLKIAVIDPRLSKTAAKGWWIPIRPGGDLALAMGMIRFVIDNRRFDEAFLRNANKAAANACGEKSWTNATWLVDLRTGKFLRAADVGVGAPHQFVAMVEGKPTAINPDDEDHTVIGDLDVHTTLHGIKAASAFRVLEDSAFAHDLLFYADAAGIPVEQIQALATEFTAHGKKAAIDFYRGPIKVTYGYYAAQAIIALNFLIGNVDHVGGFALGGGAWDGMGGKPGQPFPMAKLHPGKLTPFGVKLTCESSGPYETSTLYKRDGYPAKRPWFPFTNDVYQAIVPSANAGYPYPIKILWLHYGTPVLSVPAGHLQIAMLRDTRRIPLFIATDIVVGETSMYADYIFPDQSYLERWSNPLPTSPVVLTKISKFRQPVAAPIPVTCKIDGEEMSISMESVMLALAKRLGLSGFGKDGFAPGLPLNRPEDFYLKMVANLAAGDKSGDESPEAGQEEMDLFRRARRHLSKAAVFDEAKWRAAVGRHWRRVVYLLNRGGRFEAADDAYSGKFLKHAWANLLNLYVEPVGSGTSSVTGIAFSGVPVFKTLESINGRPVVFPEEFDLDLFTYKEIWGGQSRTSGNYVGQIAIAPENFINLNAVDAARMGLVDGDTARVVGVSFTGTVGLGAGQESKVEGKIRVVQGVRPGSTGISWHYGHWAYGARAITIDGHHIAGEPARGFGLVANPALAVDGYLKDVCLTDPIAGDSAFVGTRVRLVKVASAEGPASAPLPEWALGMVAGGIT